MGLNGDKQSATLIDPTRNRNRQISAILVIVVVVMGLAASIFTQPFWNLDETNTPSQVSLEQGGAVDPQNEAQSGGDQNNVTQVLFWIAQIIVSFIATLASIVELAGINVRELFVSRTAKTSVEDFPFHVIRNLDQLLGYLFPNPKVPLLADREIKYIPQISHQADEGFIKAGFLLIRGRSKTGKTREASEVLKRYWYTDPTVLVARTHAGLYPPFKIPENLPVRNLILFFDDLDKYVDSAEAAKRLEATIQFFQKICHDPGELRVIATIRQEVEYWQKLGFDKNTAPWNRFELVQIEPLTEQKSEALIHELADMSDVTVSPELSKTLASRNDGTFLNLVLAFRGWLNLGLKSVTENDVRKVEGVLLNTWKRRYERLTTELPAGKPIYAAIDLLQSNGVQLVPDIIREIATELYLGRKSLSLIGFLDRLRELSEMSPLLNWYRDPMRRRRGLVVLAVSGLGGMYVFMYFLLCILPGNTQTSIFAALSNNLYLFLLLLLPLWALILYLFLHAGATILHKRAHRKVARALEQLLTTEFPLRENHLRPYEGQVEGNGVSSNWHVDNYIGKASDPGFKKLASHRIMSLYLTLAEQFRRDGEYPAARHLAQLANGLVSDHPAPLYFLGRIEFEENHYRQAADLFSESCDRYGKSSTLAFAAEELALSHLYLEEYDKAVDASKKALDQMPSLAIARWLFGIATIKAGKRAEGIQACQLAAKKRATPPEIRLFLDRKGYAQEDWFAQIKEYTPRPIRQRKTKAVGVRPSRSKVLPWVITVLVTPIILICGILSLTGFVRSNLSLAIFPNSPSLIALQGDLMMDKRYEQYYVQGTLVESAITFYNAALEVDPQYAYAYMQRGQAYRALGDQARAMADLDEAIRQDPGYARAYLVRGNFQDDPQQKISDYTNAIRIDPEYYDAYASRGSVYESLGERGKAEADYRIVVGNRSESLCGTILCWSIAIDMDPDKASSYRRRGYLYDGLGEYQAAINDFTRSLELDPSNVTVYFSRGDSYQKLKNYEMARADYMAGLLKEPGYWTQCTITHNNLLCLEEAVNATPDNLEAHRLLGDVYLSLGRMSKTIHEYSEVIRLQPDDIQTYSQRSSIRVMMFDYENAVQDYDELIRLSDEEEDQSYYFLKRGELQNKLGKTDLAVADYKEAIGRKKTNMYFCADPLCWTTALNLYPDDLEIYLRRAQAFIDAGEFDQAVTDYTETIRLGQATDSNYLNRGYALSEAGDKQDAITDFSEAIDLNPENDLAFNNRGYTYYEIGEYEKAKDDFLQALRLAPEQMDTYCDNFPCWESAVELHPGDATILFKRGQSYFQAGKYESAIADLTEVIRLLPQNTDAYALRAGASEKAGNAENAILDYTEALRLNPNFYCNTILCWDTRIQFLIDSGSDTLPYSYSGRGNTYFELKKYDKAILDFTEALRLGVGEPERVLLARGNAWKATGQDQNAIADYTEAIQRSAWLVEARQNRASLYEELGQQQKANEDYAFMIQAETSGIERTLESIAEVSRRLDMIEQSQLYSFLSGSGPDFSQQLDSTTTDMWNLNYGIASSYRDRGNYHLKLGEARLAIADYTDAIDYFASAARLISAYGDYDVMHGYRHRGDAHMAIGEYQLAIDDYTKAIYITPEYAEIYKNRGTAFQKLGQQSKAAEDFQKYNELNVK